MPELFPFHHRERRYRRFDLQFPVRLSFPDFLRAPFFSRTGRHSFTVKYALERPDAVFVSVL